MKLITTFFCLLFVIIAYSQTQILEICENEPSITMTYFVESTQPTELIWWLDGFPYQGDQLTVVWDSVGVYNLSVAANSDCPSDTQNLQIIVTKCEQIIYYIPNAFTPDGDNWNNTFKPIFTEGYDPFDFHLVVYNRWGEIIFESYDASKGWNGYYGGIRCQDGVYTWKIDFGLLNQTDDKMVETGHVVLIR